MSHGCTPRALVARWLVLLFATVVAAMPLHAQRRDATRPAVRVGTAAAAEPGAELTVYLMTMGPGTDAVWERFGHNAIWIRDAATRSDIVYNWGMFDFAQPNFLQRFLTGDTKYWVEGFDAGRTIDLYRDADRSVWAQELRLTPAQRLRLRDLVRENAEPENMFYRYDYYRDNCSTRVRDMIDAVIGGRLRETFGARPTGTTFRGHTRRLTDGDFPAYTGIQIALGRPADREISMWEEMFLPLSLRARVAELQVVDSTGARVPLVVREDALYTSTRHAEPTEVPNRTLRYLALGGAIGGLFVLLGWLAGVGHRRGATIALAVALALWGLLSGVLGSAVLGAWTLTRHVFMYRNETLLQLNPLPLLLVGLAPAVLVWGRGRRLALGVAAAVAVLAVLGLAIKLLPGLGQRNGEIIAWVLPAHVGAAVALALALRAVSVGRSPQPPR